MNYILALLTSTLGRKYIMGITGFALVGFIFIHMVGNLQIFLGRDALNHYAVLLKTSAEVLWAFRIGLLAMVALHIAAAISLARDNRKARPESYRADATVQASYASRTMIWSGIIIVTFVVYHILHFTAKATHPSYHDLKAPLDGKMVPDVYGMVVHGFSSWWISGFYILAVGLLCIHLSHGISSMFQSLGLRTRSNQALLELAAPALAWVLFLGMSSVPLAVLLKWVS
ncbi:MAG: succinate dehydrogenase cytochrome b subunit [Candidatus Methylacidiphilales bacterium]